MFSVGLVADASFGESGFSGFSLERLMQEKIMKIIYDSLVGI
jgi:hypothetical protein